MRRRDKWWVREIERINREHAAERAELIAAIAHLSDRPLPDKGWAPRPGDEPLAPTPRLAAVADPEQMP